MNEELSNIFPGELPDGAKCPACGYDLRGVKIEAVCPECGTPAELVLRAAWAFRRFPQFQGILSDGARSIQISVIMTLLIVPIGITLGDLIFHSFFLFPALLAAIVRFYSIWKLAAISLFDGRKITSPLVGRGFLLSGVLEVATGLATMAMSFWDYDPLWIALTVTTFVVVNMTIQALCLYRIALLLVLPKTVQRAWRLSIFLPVIALVMTLLCLLVAYVISNFITAILLMLFGGLLLAAMGGLVQVAISMSKEIEQLKKLYSTVGT